MRMPQSLGLNSTTLLITMLCAVSPHALTQCAWETVVMGTTSQAHANQRGRAPLNHVHAVDGRHDAMAIAVGISAGQSTENPGIASTRHPGRQQTVLSLRS